MPYELDLLTRLITGDLSSTNFNLTEYATHQQFLRQRFTSCLRHFKIQYSGNTTGEFSYRQHREFCFLELDALPRLPATGLGSTEPHALGLLLADVLPRFDLTLPQLQVVSCHQTGDQFFLEVTASGSYNSLPAAQARYYYYHTRLLDEADRLRRDLPSQALQLHGPATVTLFVRHHYRAIQDLLAYTHRQLEPAALTEHRNQGRAYSLNEIHQFIGDELEKLLTYLEQAFPEYLDPTAPLTHRRRTQVLSDMQAPLAAVLFALHHAEAIPPQLLVMVGECLNRLLLTKSETNLSSQDLEYPRLLLHELHARLQRGWALTSESLACLLLRYNFNAMSFFSFLTAHLRAEATTNSQPADHLSIVLLHLKLYRQLQPATDLLYVPTLPPLRTQLINWLEAERKYLSRQAPPAASAVQEAPRILTPLSVAQIAQLARLLYDAGVFGQANQRDLFRMLAANFRTARQDRISEKSLADKYYNIEENTRLAVEQVVAKMLSCLRQSPIS